MPLKKSQTETQKKPNPDVEAPENVLITEGHEPPKRKVSSPKDGKKPKRLPFRRFFDAVREDVEVIVEALDYYKQVVEDGSKHITVRGNLEALTVETPGLAYFYRGVRTDAQQIRRWLEVQLENKKAEKGKYFHSDKEAIKQFGTLKPTEITKYVDSEEEVEDLKDLVRLTAEAEHRLEDLMEGFEERRLTLARVIDIRKENLKEVWIDGTVGDE